MYPENYIIKSIPDQIKILNLFLGKRLEVDYSKINQTTLPEGAEGFFVIPKINEDNYLKELKIISEKLKINSLVGNLKNFNRHYLTVDYFEELSFRQGNWGDVFIVPAQFGMRYQGKSVEEVLEELSFEEVPLGAYEGLCMFLTHPARMYKDTHLFLDFPGDYLKGSKKFYLNFDCQKVNVRNSQKSNFNFGSITAFF